MYVYMYTYIFYIYKENVYEYMYIYIYMYMFMYLFIHLFVCTRLTVKCALVAAACPGDPIQSPDGASKPGRKPGLSTRTAEQLANEPVPQLEYEAQMV